MADYSGGDVALIITAVGTLVTAMASAASVIVSLMNARKLELVHQTTNSLSERAENLARDLGTAQGNLQGRAEQTSERAIAKAENGGPATPAGAPFQDATIAIDRAQVTIGNADESLNHIPNKPLK